MLLIHSVSPHPVMYVVTLGVLQMCWNFIDIFQLGTLAIVDPTGTRGRAGARRTGCGARGRARGGRPGVDGRAGYWAVLLLAGGAAALATLCYSIVYGLATSEWRARPGSDFSRSEP